MTQQRTTGDLVSPMRAIVVCDDAELPALLAATVDWDLQNPVRSVDAMWADLESGRLSHDRIGVVVLAPRDPGEREAVVQAAATLAPHALTLVITWGKPVEALTIRADVETEMRRAAEQDPRRTVGTDNLLVVTVSTAAEAVREIVDAVTSQSPWLSPAPVEDAAAASALAVSASPAASAPHEPAATPDPPRADAATTVAVTSVSGGTGGTTVALLLAGTAALASAAAGQPQRVLLIDVDDRLGVHAVDMTGDPGDAPEPLAYALALDAASVHRHLVPAPQLGIDVLPAAPPTDTDAAAWVADLLDVTRPAYDVVVIDMPSHVPPAAALVADRQVLVCPMLIPALAATAARIAAAGRPAAARTVLVLNAALPGVGVSVEQAAHMVPGVRLGAVLVSAARDVQLAINHQAMHKLVLDHDVLSPALLGLTTAVLPGIALAPASPAMAGAAASPQPAKRGRGRVAAPAPAY